MEFEPPAPICELKASRLVRKLVGEAPGAAVTLYPAPSVSRYAQAKSFDAGKNASRSARLDCLYLLMRLFLR